MSASRLHAFDPQAEVPPELAQMSAWRDDLLARYRRILAMLRCEGEIVLTGGFLSDPERPDHEADGPPKRLNNGSLCRSRWKRGEIVSLHGRAGAWKVASNFLVDAWRGTLFVNVVMLVRASADDPSLAPFEYPGEDGFRPADLLGWPIDSDLLQVCDPSVIEYLVRQYADWGGWTAITSLEFMAGMPDGSSFDDALDRLRPLEEMRLVRLDGHPDDPFGFYIWPLPAFARAFVR